MPLEPVRPITLQDETGRKHALMPQSDITPIESVMIAQLLVRFVLTHWQGGPLDWRTYVADNRLERHFLALDAASSVVLKPTATIPGTKTLIAEYDDGAVVKGSVMEVPEEFPLLPPWVEATVANRTRISRELMSAHVVDALTVKP